ncbi:PREDICTED: protein white-like [Diuraphis noxia]|uniref:protein white-like n=1 Tax=Diuraphis noxia TaxID=143948 RepID=UPI000763B8D0|nr:PREDICTED: protein white-like [Diuraphis noxia]
MGHKDEKKPLLANSNADDLRPEKEHNVTRYRSLEHSNGTGTSKQQSITYTWTNINVHTKNGKSKNFYNTLTSCCTGRQKNKTERKQLLNNVSGSARPGELLALMGSSGAGKTTLLNSLTFRSNNNVIESGLRSINGIPVNSKLLTAVSAYVQQNDLFIGTLTVREHLIFQAMVRMDRHIPYEKRMARVEDSTMDSWGSNVLENVSSPYKATWMEQFSAVFWRSWLSIKKEPALTKIRLVQTMLVAALISFIFFNQHLDQDGVMNINGALFMCISNMTFQNVLAVINIIIFHNISY